jgi:hypothetical protein
MMSFRKAAGRHPDADSVSGVSLHSCVPRSDSDTSANVVAPGNHDNRLPRTSNEPCGNAADIAAIGRGFGFEGVTVRDPADLAPVRGWLAGPRERPLLIDAKVTSAHGSWWLEEAFRGH